MPDAEQVLKALTENFHFIVDVISTCKINICILIFSNYQVLQTLDVVVSND